MVRWPGCLASCSGAIVPVRIQGFREDQKAMARALLALRDGGALVSGGTSWLIDPQESGPAHLTRDAQSDSLTCHGTAFSRPWSASKLIPSHTWRVKRGLISTSKPRSVTRLSVLVVAQTIARPLANLKTSSSGIPASPWTAFLR